MTTTFNKNVEICGGRGEKSMGVLSNELCRPANQIERDFNTFVEVVIVRLLGVVVKHWGQMIPRYCGTPSNFAIYLANSKNLTRAIIFDEMLKIYKSWRNGQVYILSYRESMKLVVVPVHTILLRCWMFSVLSTKYDSNDPQPWHHFTATYIQSVWRGHRVRKKVILEKNILGENILNEFIFDEVTKEEVYNGVLDVGEEEIIEATLLEEVVITDSV